MGRMWLFISVRPVLWKWPYREALALRLPKKRPHRHLHPVHGHDDPCHRLLFVPNDVRTYDPSRRHRVVGGKDDLRGLPSFCRRLADRRVLPASPLGMVPGWLVAIVRCFGLCRGHRHPFERRSGRVRSLPIAAKAEGTDGGGLGSSQPPPVLCWRGVGMEWLVLVQWRVRVGS